MKTLVVTMALLLGLLAFGEAAPAVRTWDASNIVWQNVYPDGTKWSVLEGNKDAPAKSFTYAFFIPAGYWEHHSHNQDARVAVLSGTLKLSIGPSLDKEDVKAYPVGSFILVPANVEHTMVPMSTLSSSERPWARGRHITMRNIITNTRKNQECGGRVS